MEWVLAAALLLLFVLVLLALRALYRPLQEMARVQVELRGVTERIGALERNQGAVGHNLTILHSELSQARLSMNTLQSQAATRASLDQQVADSVRRLETIIAGTHSKGAAGENILDVVFAQLPVEWQVRDFRVGNKTVEFALRLPNNRILPIDSKWPATGLIERFIASEDIAEQARLKAQIEDEVLRKAREVKKYVDGHQTVDYGVAVVPDAVYDLCPSVQSRCFIEHGVVLVAYSMFIPYVLLVVQTTLKTSQNIDLEKLETHLRGVEKGVRTLQQEIDGRFSRAMTFLENSRADMKAQLDRMDSSLTHLYLGAGMEQAGDEIEPASAVAAAHDLV